jgi:hypothetical protein
VCGPVRDPGGADLWAFVVLAAIMGNTHRVYAMAVIQVGTIDSETGSEVPGTRLRTGSAQAAVDHAGDLNAKHLPPRYSTRILYWGEFVDPAFAELSQLAQQRGLEVEIGGA